jgi:hypothetical protein
MDTSTQSIMSDTVTIKTGLTFRQVAFDDYEKIAALQSRYAIGIESYEAWSHLWANNPTFHEFQNWPMGWVLENEHNEIVGHVANIPLRYELANQRLVASASRAVVVDARYRSYSFQLLSRFFYQKPVDLFLATTVNAQASKANQVFRVCRVPVGQWDRSAFWITNYLGFSESLLAMKEIYHAKALGYPVATGLFLRDLLGARRFKAQRNGVEPEFCPGFDERFDEFWQQLRTAYPRQLLAVRSREMLEWHFKHALARNRAWVLTISKGSSLMAYGIFFRQDNPAHALTRMRLVDFQVLGGNTDLLRPILCHALSRCRREGIHMLEAIGFSAEKQQVIESLAPHARNLSSWRYFYKAGNRPLAETLKNPAVWDPSCFDGDASL